MSFSFVRKSSNAIRPPIEAFFQLCCLFQSKEAKALGDLALTRLNNLSFSPKVILQVALLQVSSHSG
jgi:hypothetical protein